MLDMELADPALNKKIEYVVGNMLRKHVRYDCGCRTADGDTIKFRLKRGIKKYKADYKPAYKRFLASKKRGMNHNVEYKEDKYEPDSCFFNKNALRWRFACGLPKLQDESLDKYMAKRCDGDQFLGFVDDKGHAWKPDMADVAPEEHSLYKVVFDNFTTETLEDRRSDFCSATGYVPSDVYAQAKKMLQYDIQRDASGATASHPVPRDDPSFTTTDTTSVSDNVVRRYNTDVQPLPRPTECEQK